MAALVNETAQGLDAEAERALLERAKAGDRGAFEALVVAAYPSLARFCESLAGRDRAQDVAQEAVLRALRSLEGFRGTSRFRSWLLTIARNAYLNERARMATRMERGGEAELDDQPGRDESPAAGAERSELRAQIDAALAELPEEQRTALVLCDREGLSYREIAEAMGTPIGTVMSRIFYARNKLKKSLGGILGL